jgi:hypothetical protein
VAGDAEGVNEVEAAIGAFMEERGLGSGEDDGFGEVFAEEGEGGGGIGHGVSAVEDDEAVPEGVVTFDDGGDGEPVAGADVGGVDGGQGWVDEEFPVDVVAFTDGGDIGKDVVLGAGPASGVRESRVDGDHADGAAGVEDEDSGGGHGGGVGTV